MKINHILLASMLMIGASACEENKFYPEPPLPEQGETPDVPQPEEPGASSRDEQYRPQVHYTPARNWINDPNGMIYIDGVWHLYYQYNPQGKLWGNLSWGHATSTDLIHWTEKPVAMTPNEWGMIFSGSCVVDVNNTAGFGAGALVAIYTSATELQQESIAYSLDGGLTFTQYEGNPVITTPIPRELRDPKVFWDKKSNQWVMSLACGWSTRIEFWGSPDLKNWSKLSEFTSESARSNIGQWECPDLFPLPYNGGEKWILIVSNNPGGPCGGSGTEYFIGDWDGTKFTADQRDYPLWLDFGADNYAGVTWNDAPDGRRIMIGWMNNWDYANEVPVAPWTSANTLPRELTLTTLNGEPVVSSKVIANIDGIAGQWQTSADGRLSGGDAYEVKFTVPLTENGTFRIANGNGQYLEVEVNAEARTLMAKRTGTTGEVGFNNLFARPSVIAPANVEGDEVELHVYIDRSSVEILNETGTMNMTNLVFPSVPYDRIEGVGAVEYRTLKSIW